MTDTATDTGSTSKGSRKPLFAGLALAVVGAVGSFVVVSGGFLGAVKSDSLQSAPADVPLAMSQQVAFVPIDTLIISLPGSNGRDHLRFTAQLEVDPALTGAVAAIKPRIVDVLNGYLRAVDLADLEDPAALMRLRAQMLRRVQIVAGEGLVKDLLIMEFVLS